MNKELSRLIALRNEYKNKNEYDLVEKVRKQIKELKNIKREKKDSRGKYVKKEKPIKIDRKKKRSEAEENNVEKKFKKKYKKKNKEKKLNKNTAKLHDVVAKTKIKKKKNKDNVYNSEIMLTKKQENLLNEFCLKNIHSSNVLDFYTVFMYYSSKYDMKLDDLTYFITYFKNNFVSVDNVIVVEKFFKEVKKIIKDKYSNSDKKKINSICIDIKKDKINESTDTPIYQILLYFIESGNSYVSNQLVDRLPDIVKCKYNNKSIILNILELLLDKYNIILTNSKDEKNLIELVENIFVKLYKMDSSEKDIIKLILDSYISELKYKKITTVARNLVLTRINKLNEAIGLEVNSQYYPCLGDIFNEYYQMELKNKRRREIIDDTFILSELPNVSYSLVKIDDYVSLKINVVDLSIYFLDGTFANEILLKNKDVSVDVSHKYTKYTLYKPSPSITFEFYFNKNILEYTRIYSSIVNPSNVTVRKKECMDILNGLGVNSLVKDFNELIKISLTQNSKDKIPYIVSYKDDLLNYRMYTDLNYMFSQLDSNQLNVIFKILNNSSIKYCLSDEIINGMEYDLNILNNDINYYTILMQNIIKSYYDDSYSVSYEHLSEYVNQKNKVKTI